VISRNPWFPDAEKLRLAQQNHAAVQKRVLMMNAVNGCFGAKVQVFLQRG